MPLTNLSFDPSACLIDGQWRPASEGGSLPLMNPSNGSKLCEIAKGTETDVDALVKASRKAYEGDWGRTPAATRGRILMRLGQLVLDHVDTLTKFEALDVGKPLKQARADAIALARYMEFYGGAADKLHGETIPYLNDYTVYTLREAHGVTGHIVPWNYPIKSLGVLLGQPWQWEMLVC